MKRTLITVAALLMASVEKTRAQQIVSNNVMGQANVMHADISDMVIEEDMMHLRQLVTAN